MSHARKEYKDFMTLAPDVYEMVRALGQAAAKAGIDKQLLELVKLRASQINGCAFCVQFHILQGESLGIPVDKLNLVVVWREAPQFSARGAGMDGGVDAGQRRRQRCGLCGSERRVFREGIDLSQFGNRLDQCLEQVRRRLSLDPAGAAKNGSCGVVGCKRRLGWL
jgi:AhpD family alkylhydroperoxidase